MIDLPRALPVIDVATEGLLGGRVAEAVGLRRVRSGDSRFDARYRVIAPDERAGRAVLTPELIALMRPHPPAPWRVDGTTMISHAPGRLIAGFSPITQRLDLMCDILDVVQVSVTVTRPRGGRARALRARAVARRQARRES